MKKFKDWQHGVHFSVFVMVPDHRSYFLYYRLLGVKFLSSITMILWKALLSDVSTHTTSFNQSECFISVQCSNTTLKFGYNISSWLIQTNSRKFCPQFCPLQNVFLLCALLNYVFQFDSALFLLPIFDKSQLQVPAEWAGFCVVIHFVWWS